MSRYYDGGDAESYAAIDTAKGERFIAEADAWIEANPGAWEWMTSRAVASAMGHRRFSIGALCESVRWEMFARGIDDFKLNNNHRAAFARRIIREHPETEPYIVRRHSACDLMEEGE